MKRSKWFQALSITLALAVCAGSSIQILAQEELPSRDVYVVYDDSGSMYQDWSKLDTGEDDTVDTWSKAKYAMEVFTAMLNSKDSLNVYYMSDYSDGTSDASPRIEIQGSDDTKKNVQKIHEERTYSKETPFEAVEAAYEDLEDSSADEKWLVILTDGEFRDPTKNKSEEEVKAQVNTFFKEKDPDVQTVFLLMGQIPEPVTPDAGNGIYIEKAEDSTQILEKTTEIANRIFNMNRVDAAADTGEFELKIPMSELTVFAQGDGVEITGLIDGTDKETGTMNPAVTVSATEKSDNDSPDHQDNKPAQGLQGQLAVFEGQFQPGTYKVKAKNAREIEVYYKPDLEVIAYLENEEGTTISNLEEVPAGTYTLHFRVVNGIDHSELSQAAMAALSENGLEYEAAVSNNGQKLDQTFNDGDTINVEDGKLDVEVTAHFLKYNTAKTQISNTAVSDKAVTFSLDEHTPWTLGKNGLANDGTTLVKMDVAGKAPTEAEWAKMEAPAISITANNDLPLEAPILTKTDQPGIFELSPADQKDWPNEEYKTAKLSLAMNQNIDGIDYHGEMTSDMEIHDQRPDEFFSALWWKKHGWKWILGLALFVLLIGWIPGIKKYLPRSLVQDPAIVCQPRKRSEKEKTDSGAMRKNFWPRILPFAAQTAEIPVVPRSANDISLPKLQVKALGGNQMELTNEKSFADKNVTIGSKKIEAQNPQTSAAAAPAKDKKAAKGKKAKKKPFLIRPNATIVSEGNDYIYECKLNKSYKKKKR